MGRMRDGLYYLVNHLTDSWAQDILLKGKMSALTSEYKNGKDVPDNSSSLTLWNNRLGHASLGKLKNIACVKPYTQQTTKVCITCPMAKFTKLSYTLSNSHAQPISTDLFDFEDSEPKSDDTPPTPYPLHSSSPSTPQNTPSPTHPPPITPNNSPTPPPVRKSTRTHNLSVWSKDYIMLNKPSFHISNLAFTTIQPDFSYFLSSLTKETDPIHFKDAVKHSH
uniref:GAG-pre-integrase domain-containing protein n=1 Tax=Chenopodium quinoa TaxID=63459 RepID=A0A803LWX7_CHEQI